MHSNYLNPLNSTKEKQNIQKQSYSDRFSKNKPEPAPVIQIDSPPSTTMETVPPHPYYFISNEQQVMNRQRNISFDKQQQKGSHFVNSQSQNISQGLNDENLRQNQSQFDKLAIYKLIYDQNSTNLQSGYKQLKQAFQNNLKLAQQLNKKVNIWAQIKGCVNFIHSSNLNYNPNHMSSNINGTNFVKNNKLYVIGQTNRYKYSITQKQTKEKAKIINEMSNQQIQQKLTHLNHFFSYLTSIYPYTLNSLVNGNALRYSNLIQIPVYLFQQKRWTTQSFRIKNFQIISQNYKLLNHVRQTLFNPNNSNTLNGIPLSNKRSNQKSSIFFPNQLSSMAYCRDKQSAHILYLYGGINQQLTECSNTLYKMDFELKTLQVLQQRGEYPQPRQNAFLFHYNSLWLVLYGGNNMNQCQVYNDFYIYSIAQQTWYQINGDFQYLVNARINSAMAFTPTSRTLFLFGGMLYDYQNKPKLLNDMYEFKLLDIEMVFKRSKDGKREKGKVQVRSIFNKYGNKWPAPRMGHQMISLNQNYLLMLGGQTNSEFIQNNEQNSSVDFDILKKSNNSLKDNKNVQNKKNYFHNLEQSIWLFNLKSKQWVQIICWNDNYFPKGRCHFGISTFPKLKNIQNQRNEVYVIAGLSNGAAQTIYDNYQSLNKILKISIETKYYQSGQKYELQQKQSDKINRQTKLNSNCQICVRKINSLHLQQYQTPIFSAQFIDNYLLSSMKFPFDAFGLFSSLCLQRQATRMNIQYRNYISSTNYNDNYIQIQDDGLLPYTCQQLFTKILSLNIHDQLQLMGLNDKKYKLYQTRQRGMINFCNQLKLSGLRIGQQIFWINLNSNNQAIVMMIRKQKIKQSTSSPQEQLHNQDDLNSQYVYKTYFYGVNMKNGQICPPSSKQVKLRVQRRYAMTIRQFIKDKRNSTRGSLFRISHLRTKNISINGEFRLYHQISPVVSKNTLKVAELYHKIRNFAFGQHLRLEQSIDVDLQTYLSMLYINRVIRMSVKVNYAFKKDQDQNKIVIPTQTYPYSSIRLYKSIKKPQTVQSLAKHIESHYKKTQDSNQQKDQRNKQEEKYNKNNLQIRNKFELSMQFQKLDEIICVQNQGQNQNNKDGQRELMKSGQQQKTNNKKDQQNNNTIVAQNRQNQPHNGQDLQQKNESANNQNHNQQKQPKQTEKIVEQNKQQQVDKQPKQKENNVIQEEQNNNKVIEEFKQKQNELKSAQNQNQVAPSAIINNNAEQIQSQPTLQNIISSKLQKQKSLIQQLIKKQNNTLDVEFHKQKINEQISKKFNEQAQNKNPAPTKNNFILNGQVNKLTKNKNNNQEKQQDLVNNLEKSINKFTQISPHFTLSKIDALAKKGKIYQIDLEVFSDFDLKTVQVYYWKREEFTYQNKNQKKFKNGRKLLGGMEENQQKKDKFNNSESQKFKQKSSELPILDINDQQESDQFSDMLYPNGLLIYHKNRLIKRYGFQLGMQFQHQLPGQTGEFKRNYDNPISNKKLEPFYRSASNHTFNLFGMIQLPQKFNQNLVGNGFMNEYLLERLYEKIENVANWCQKNWGIWSELSIENKKTQQLEDQKNEQKGNQKGKKKIKPNQNI